MTLVPFEERNACDGRRSVWTHEWVTYRGVQDYLVGYRGDDRQQSAGDSVANADVDAAAAQVFEHL